jgi:hypothetical protein
MPYEGSVVAQPHGAIRRIEIILAILREDEAAELERIKSQSQQPDDRRTRTPSYS